MFFRLHGRPPLWLSLRRSRSPDPLLLRSEPSKSASNSPIPHASLSLAARRLPSWSAPTPNPLHAPAAAAMAPSRRRRPSLPGRRPVPAVACIVAWPAFRGHFLLLLSSPLSTREVKQSRRRRRPQIRCLPVIPLRLPTSIAVSPSTAHQPVDPGPPPPSRRGHRRRRPRLLRSL